MSGSEDHSDVSGYLSVLWIFLAVIVSYMLWEYSNPKVFPWHTYPTLFVEYFCAFGIILLVPLDISVTIVGRRSLDEKGYYESNVHTIINMYLSLYWPLLVLSNVVIVFQEQYNRSGYFTLGSRLKDCVKKGLITSAAGMVAGCIFFGILVGEGVIAASTDAVLLTAVLITNTIGLVFLMFLLGYGLVSYPMMLWGCGNLELRLLRAQQKAAMEFKNLADTSLDISLTVSDVLRTKQELPKFADQEVNEVMEVLLRECPPDFTSSKMGKVAVDKQGKVTVHTLAALRLRLYWHMAKYGMALGRTQKIQLQAYYLEDLLEATQRRDGVRQIKWSFKGESTEREFLWHVKIKPILYRVAAVLCGCLSAFSYLGVIGGMQGVSTDVSVYSLAVHKDNTTGNGITVFVLFTLGYACYVTMWSLFEMKIANFMELVTNQGTWPLSMSFNARMVARLSAPLAFFYLGWLHENQTRDGSWSDAPSDDDVPYLDNTDKIYTAFSRFYEIQVVPVMGDSFNTFFPILLMCVSFLTLTNILNRILVWVKAEELQFGQAFISEELLREGKRQLTKRKAILVRQYKRHKIESRIEGIITSTTEAVSKIFSLGFFSRPVDQEAPEDIEIPITEIAAEPPALEGFIEKKGGKTLGISGNWQTRYFIMKKPCMLEYYKEKSNQQEPQGHIDLRLVMSFTINDSDGSKLELMMADKTIKLKFKTKEDASTWRDGLMAWKDWAIDYALYNGEDAFIVTGNSDEAYAARLNDIVVDDETEDENVGLTKGRYSSSSSSASSAKAASKAKAPSAVVALTAPSADLGSFSQKPAPLEGWLEKKSPSKMSGNSWQRRYCRVDEATHQLIYYKTESSTEPQGSIDLKLVVDVVAYEKDGKKDLTRFNVDSGEKQYKMRAISASEGERWIDGLNEWRDYFLLNMC